MKNFRQNAVSELVRNGISKNEAIAEIDTLIEYVSGLSRKDFVLNPDIKLTDEQYKKIEALIKRRIEERIPVQYLTNTAYFMGYKFYVNENVLIPRPETEMLVKEALNLAKEFKNPKLIDIGTGSGCIACSLAKLSTKLEITASDISEKALEVAKINAKKLGVENKITFKLSDIFSNIENKFDIIVSNPPYISKKEAQSLQIEVYKHEPHLALFVDDEKGISFYEKLIDQAKFRLNEVGFIAFEIGISQADYIIELLERSCFNKINVIKDLAGIERIITAQINFSD